MNPQRLQVDRNLSTHKKHLSFPFHLALPLTTWCRVLRVTHHRHRNSNKKHFCGILILLCSGLCSQANHEHKQPQSLSYPGTAFRIHHNTQVLPARLPSLLCLFNPQTQRQGEACWLLTCQGGSRSHMGPESATEQTLKRNQWNQKMILRNHFSPGTQEKEAYWNRLYSTAQRRNVGDPTYERLPHQSASAPCKVLHSSVHPEVCFSSWWPLLPPFPNSHFQPNKWNTYKLAKVL